MIKLIRRLLGIEEDKKEIFELFAIVAESIDIIFDLKKKDKSVMGMVNLIRIKKLGEKLK